MYHCFLLQWPPYFLSNRPVSFSLCCGVISTATCCESTENAAVSLGAKLISSSPLKNGKKKVCEGRRRKKYIWDIYGGKYMACNARPRPLRRSHPQAGHSEKLKEWEKCALLPKSQITVDGILQKEKKIFPTPLKPLIRIKTHNFKLSLELHDM